MLITPGPAVLYIIARSIEQGKIAGLMSTLGVALGGLCHVLFAAFGLSIILVQSAIAFSLIKYLGAAYLIYLGIIKLRQKNTSLQKPKLKKIKRIKIFTDGFIVNLFNPKTALFFIAFLPQFVNPEQGSPTKQIIYLGIIFISLAVVSDSIYALLAGSARKLFNNSKAVTFFNTYIPATVYLALGIGTIFIKK